MYHTRTYNITGVTPLMMHNGQLANPLNPLAIELGKLTKKKGKTEADHIACAKLEFLGSCYYDKKRNKFLIPDMCIEAGIKASAVAKQRGIKKTVESAILVYDHGIITDFSGPKTPLDRWEAGEAYYDQRMVVIRGRVLRTRPIFDDWKATFSVKFDDTKINGTLLDDIITVWGDTVGMLELRPKYGRFEVTNVTKE